jgi:asparagine synthase (glutamine-hydrolysing)
MCGICGELRFDGSAPDLAAIGRMTAALARRGPDHEGAHADGPLAFGHRRLAVIDLSESSDQPMVDSQLKLAVIFNGTIYNYRELRAELAGLGYHFFSHGDTEVILKAYHAWGEACVPRFNGMFAFAVWDAHQHELFLARDRTGIKPLYYTLDGQRLRFASTLPALLAGGGVDTSIDPVALHQQLTLHAVVPAPRTILNGIRKLAPASTLWFDAKGRRRECRYWELRAARPAAPRSESATAPSLARGPRLIPIGESDWIEATRVAVTRAVEHQFETADTPVGVLLSGGLDSSLLVGLLDHLGVHDIPTFSIGFESTDEERADEFEFSDVVAQRFHTRHHRYLLPNSEILTHLSAAVSVMSEPMVSQDVVAFYLLAERVKKEVKAVLCGQGADEVFGGYYWYPRMDADSGSDLERLRRHYFDRTHASFLDVVTPAYRGADHTGELIGQLLAQPGADTFLDRVLRLDVTTLVVDDPVKRVDNLTMAFGLEARVPFLDHELIELAMQMPPELKLKSEGKFPLKAVARGLIPDSVIDRPKGYFPIPVLKRIRGPFLKLMREILTSDACRQRGVFDRGFVDRLLAAPDKEPLTPIGGSTLRHLALLELWFQLVVDP